MEKGRWRKGRRGRCVVLESGGVRKVLVGPPGGASVPSALAPGHPAQLLSLLTSQVPLGEDLVTQELYLNRQHTHTHGSFIIHFVGERESPGRERHRKHKRLCPYLLFLLFLLLLFLSLAHLQQ